MSQRTASSNSCVSQNAVAVRRRPDLVAVQTRHKHDAAYVVKDPIAMKYHRMRTDEFFVLEKLDGQISLRELQDAYESRFAPHKVSAADLNRLLLRFHQSGLTLSDAMLQGNRLHDRRRKDRRQQWVQRISGILFIRFPGVDPEPLLRMLYPLVRPLLGGFGRMLALMVCLVAAILLATRWESFAAEFPRMNQWLRLEAILILAGVIGLTKVFHELGHALVCKHFGGECHQIGPMLLVFTPALYCDTSDSWMLGSRWQRAAVGLAGIAAEVLMAAIATWIWAFTAPGLIHYISMNVMLVCSISTLLFNANPLLRYDGYYVLSDICDTPNLGERSRKLLAAHTNKLLLGVNELPREPMTRVGRFGLLAYAIAAVAYRWALTLMILWIVSMVLRPYDLESLGRVLCLFAAVGMVVALLRAPARFFVNPARRKKIQMKRTLLSAVALASLVAMAFYPLPSGISASARIVPRHEAPIYITTAGSLHEVSRFPGEFVSQGDQIARLVNLDVELQYLKAKGRFETQQQIVESIRLSSLDSPQAGNQLPAQQALLEDLREQMETRRQRVEGLLIRAPADGKLITSPRRTEQPQSPHRLVSWSGYPTEENNRDCRVEPGLELMSVATDDLWDAELILSQSQVDRVVIGAAVKLVLEATPQVKITGQVVDVSRSQWNSEQNAQRRDDSEAVRRTQPPSTSYVVRVRIDQSDAVSLAGAAATSRIEAQPMSLVHRISRSLNSLLRFR